MAKRLGINELLPPKDSLFSTQEERDDTMREKVLDIALNSIDPFPEHPFRVIEDESMRAMVDSVKLVGIQNPAVVRPKEDERYELISGHRRKMACRIAGLDTMPCIVRKMTQDEAIIAMVDSNLQRDVILPSEKAKSYKMKYDAMKRRAGRKDGDNASRLGTDLRSDDKLALISGDSRTQIQR
jgi:ParB family chromosome partitioning protein